MTEPASPTRDDRLEAYLDGLLDDAERAEFEAALAGEPTLRAAAELQTRVDASLRRAFGVAPPSEQQVTMLLASKSAAEAEPGSLPWARLGWIAGALAAAAAVAWALLGNPLAERRGDGRQFVARPLPDVYREALANGFEPAYNCTEAERFADTFNRRQGAPLKLLKLPIGVRMLGLAYPGGLSRDTTAMLCRVDGQPVMLFVDRSAADQAFATDHSDKSVRVFRAERDGLVFYEVTPHDKPRVLDFVAPITAAGPSELPSANSAA
jgi:anti-sigma factor RsiW